jgi:hypothetical protein
VRAIRAWRYSFGTFCTLTIVNPSVTFAQSETSSALSVRTESRDHEVTPCKVDQVPDLGLAVTLGWSAKFLGEQRVALQLEKGPYFLSLTLAEARCHRERRVVEIPKISMFRVGSSPGESSDRTRDPIARRSPLGVRPSAVSAGAVPSVAGAHCCRTYCGGAFLWRRLPTLPALRHRPLDAADCGSADRTDSHPFSGCCARTDGNPAHRPLLASNTLQPATSSLHLAQASAFGPQSDFVPPRPSSAGEALFYSIRLMPKQIAAAPLSDRWATSSFAQNRPSFYALPAGCPAIRA